ncbi:RNA 2'-phosphotransferase [uncultured Enterococcus sp.]|uniref:RNA 2'-phosphotransferase n=1 Tax=uncultured Enterococcus sp. TaxID=167972 RepID=UPI002AA819F1|nr:RNA 2'-phosphotransferase [uncultured Enterococcus sp.]
MLTKEEQRISKTISYALRHKPEEFRLVLDTDGFVALDEFIEKMNRAAALNLTTEQVHSLLTRSDKTRWEITNRKIRAVYGHSTKQKIQKESVLPPEYLYHGTAHRFLTSILSQGLIPKDRQYVHLSQDTKTAMIVGKRRDASPVILRVSAQRAATAGVQFYQELEGIWLSDAIAADYLEVIED